MKRLFFIHNDNRCRVKNLGSKDTVLYLGQPTDKKGPEPLEYVEDYVRILEDKSKQIRFYYGIAWLQEWAFKEFPGRKSFAQELIFEGKSLWYSLEYFLHTNFYLLDYDAPVSRVLINIDCIKNILKDKKPGVVYVENSKSCFNRLVILICKKERIDVKELGFKEKKRSLYQAASNNPMLAGAYISGRILLRSLIGKLFCKKTGRADVLVLTSDRLSNKYNVTDYYWGPVISELKKRNVSFKVVEYDRIETWESLKSLKNRYLPQKYDAQFIGTYYDRNTTKNARMIVAFMKNKFRELDADKRFRESFEYNGIPFYDLIRQRMKKIFVTYAHYIADVHAVTMSMVKNEKPKIVLVDHEKNYYGRGLIIEANLHNIKSFAFEGEAIYGNNTYQTHIALDSVLNRKNPLWRPIADKKFMWGEYTKEWYEKKNFFPSKNLMIVGAPKYDLLKKLGIEDEQEIRDKYGLKSLNGRQEKQIKEKKKKIITVITAEWPRQVEYLTSIAKSLRARDDYKLIIKMHPLDSPLNKGMIEQIMKKFGADAVVVQYEDCSKLIYASELVLTCASTIVYECILLDKKVLVFGSGEDEEQPYVKEGVVKLCKSAQDFAKSIISSLDSATDKTSGKASPSLAKKKRSEFIRKYLYSDDGKSSVRAVDEITKHI